MNCHFASRPIAAGFSIVLLAASATLSFAATTDIANVPLGAQTTTVKPNIMFILDDSGSMASAYMPDNMSNTGRYGYYSPQCNGLAFNPNLDYSPPLKADGTSYSASTFTAALNDGFKSTSGTTDLSQGGYYYYVYTGSETPMNWTYSSSGAVITTTTFYKECQSAIGSNPGAAKFTQVFVNAQDSNVQEKYANWYSYYRTRLQTMRTSVGRAFSSLDSNYRVGFTMISDKTVSGTNFLNVADFTETQKASFYTKLYSSYSGSYTPLRGALSKVGRYYGKRYTGQTDPVQYSCQRNFALLSTDGYWNDNTESTSYGPLMLDGSTEVGQQDGTEDRPMKDSTASTTIEKKQTDTSVTSTFNQTQYSAASNKNTGGCTGGKYLVTQQAQTCTVTWTKTNISNYTTTGTTTTVALVSETTRPTCTSWSNSGGSSTSCKSNFNGLGGLTVGGTSQVAGTTSDSNGASTTTVLETTTTGGDSNSLADVAEYYWKTDLRTDTGFANNVVSTTTDSATWQHLNTYTVGLGVRGTLAYDSAYLTQTTGDFTDIKNGVKNWPVPSGTLGGSENATHVDDLWHAAVNGRGQYFSATDPKTLSDAIKTMLEKVKEQTGAGAAAAASTLTPVTGDDWIFLPSYTTQSWIGDLRAFKFTFVDGKAVPPSDTSTGKEIWSVKSRLDSRTTERTIYFNRGGTLTDFTYDNLTAAGLNGNFDNRCTTSGASLSQCNDVSDIARPKVTGQNLVNYLRGDTSLYLNAASTDDQVFRTRSSRLGDFGNASPAYVGKPPFKYTDSGYSSFASAHAARTTMVYAGANDGMLHAIQVGTGSGDTSGGVELWAFVPTPLMSNLWRLASDDYKDNHRYFVDATPVVADVYDSVTSQWRTVLVGGFGAGGRGYYALDITTPETPTLLWEISNATTGFSNLGLSYGNPIITKNSAGTWLVAFSSGVNNVSTGDGIGRLYVVNAVTGAKVTEVTTGVGDTTTPSNLNRIEGWIDADTNNTALRFYGGDMQGNLWRFDHDNQILPAGNEALLLGQAQTSSGAVQPITTRPLLTRVTSNGTAYNVIAVGTGRYLGLTDLVDDTLQSLYAVKDALSADNLCVPRSNALPCVLNSTAANLVQQTLGSDRKLSSTATVNWASSNGWYINFNQSTGERVFIDPTSLNGSSIAVSTTVPSSSVCTPGGTSYIYELSLASGAVNQVSAYDKLIVGMSRILNPDGSSSAFVTFGDQSLKTDVTVSGSGTGSTTIKRATWRELID